MIADAVHDFLEHLVAIKKFAHLGLRDSVCNLLAHAFTPTLFLFEGAQTGSYDLAGRRIPARRDPSLNEFPLLIS